MNKFDEKLRVRQRAQEPPAPPSPNAAAAKNGRASRHLKKLEAHLIQLGNEATPDSRIWLDANGQALGRYFNSSLTSVFQPIRTLDTGRIVGFQGLARSFSESDSGLSLWRLLDHAASDDESIELDRLCRLLHTINFFRQPEALDTNLFISVHARLLAAVEDNHGMDFRRVLDSIEVPHQNIILQLPAIATQGQHWLLDTVSTNYRRNGFRIAVNASRSDEAIGLLKRVHPDAIKLDVRAIEDVVSTIRLLLEAETRNIPVIFKWLESAESLAALKLFGETYEQQLYAQGYLWDVPQASLTQTEAAKRRVERMAA